MRRVQSALLVAGLVAGAAVALPVAADAATVTPGAYTAIAPYRAANSATGVNGNRKGRLNHGQSSRVSLAGHVPATASAAVVSLSVLGATTNGVVTAYQDGLSKVPAVWTELFAKGTTTTVTAVVPLRSARFLLHDGQAAGSLDFTVDVLGYYAGGSVASSAPGLLRLQAPRRVRSTITVGAGHSVTVDSGITGTRATVVAMVHAMAAGTYGSLSVYPTDTPAPPSTLYYPAGYGYSGLQQVRVDTDGKFVVLNQGSRAVKIAVDVLGWSLRYGALAAGALQTIAPSRIVNGVALKAGAVGRFTVAGRAGMALTGTGVALVGVAVGAPERSGGVVLGAPQRTSIATRNISFGARQTVESILPVPTSDGKIDIRNASSGALKVYIDVLGYYPTNAITVPPTTRARYTNDLTADVEHDQQLMDAYGCEDGEAGTTLALLDVGAQSITGPELSAQHPGVLLTGTAAPVRITYPVLVAAVTAYLDGVHRCAPGLAATVAVGTNNDGVWDAARSDRYLANPRGGDWLTKVIAPLAAVAPAGLTVQGAIDIEAGFASDQYQANDWENDYLTAAKAAGLPQRLIDNGDAEGCPTTYGSGATCSYGWTLAQYVQLAYHGGAVSVLPQIYSVNEAPKWANIDAAGKHRLVFAGSLTQFGAAGTSTFTPSQGWAALVRALGWGRTSVSVPRALDIAYDTPRSA